MPRKRYQEPTKQRFILGVDPSSTLTGYAVLNLDGKLIDAGLLKPDKTSAPALDRVDSMLTGLDELLREHKPEWTILELPSGHVHGKFQKTNMGVLAILGMAVGKFHERLRAAQQGTNAGMTLVTVSANDWTGGVKKAKRQASIALQFKRQYKIGDDKGADCADAIGLCQWYIEQLRLGGVGVVKRLWGEKGYKPRAIAAEDFEE